MSHLVPRQLGFRQEAPLELVGCDVVRVWSRAGDDEILETLRGRADVVPLLTEADTQFRYDMFLLQPSVEGWPDGTYLLCASDREYQPGVCLWASEGLLLVASECTCWAVEIATAGVAFGHNCLFPLPPEILPDGRHALIPAETYLDCVSPQGEVLWWYDVGHPYDHRVNAGGNVHVRDIVREEPGGITIDRWRGTPKTD